MNEQAYRAASEQAVYLDRSSAGCVEITGRDRLVLINRLSTNAVLNLAPGTGQITVLTTNIGRIIDLITILAIDDDTIWAITSANRGAQLTTYLGRNKFYGDQFKVRDVTESVHQMRVYGSQATAILEQLTNQALEQVGLWQHVSAEIDGCPVRLARIRPMRGAGWAIFADLAAADALCEAFDDAKAALLDRETYHTLRVEAGYPALNELNEEYIPLEANLWDAVSFNKGCYIGQEIIARMDSRGRLAKKLQGLQLSGVVEVPAQLLSNGKDAGTLTSVVWSPDLKQYIGLGYVRTAHEIGSQFSVGEQQATMVELPFIAQTEPTTVE